LCLFGLFLSAGALSFGNSGLVLGAQSLLFSLSGRLLSKGTLLLCLPALFLSLGSFSFGNSGLVLGAQSLLFSLCGRPFSCHALPFRKYALFCGASLLLIGSCSLGSHQLCLPNSCSCTIGDRYNNEHCCDDSRPVSTDKFAASIP